MIRFNKKAENGVGFLLLFITMLIVASITANVLIQTSGSLRNQALKTGKAAKESVSTYVRIEGITAMNGVDHTLEDMKVQIKLAAGSSPIELSELLLGFELEDATIDLTYSTNSCTYDQATGYYTNSTAENGTFTIKSLIESKRYKEGYIQSGDVIELCFRTPRDLVESEMFKLRLIPKAGIPIEIETMTPGVIFNGFERLYP